MRVAISAFLFPAALLACFALAPAAAAQDYRLSVTPYVWIAGMKGEFAANSSLPTISAEADFEDIIEETQFAFLGKIEASDGFLHLIAELTYVDIGLSTVVDGPVLDAASLGSESFLGSIAAGARVFDGDAYSLDLISGIRYTWTNNDFVFDTVGTAPPITTGSEEAWGDLFAGVRGAVDMTDSWFLSAYGDVGAGQSDYTWQLYGAVNWEINQNTILFGGYRIYEDKYDDDGYLYHVTQKGPILGATISF
jgi:hypothetical protein